MRFGAGSDAEGMAFISDPAQDVTLEFFHNPVTPLMTWEGLARLALHFALKSVDPLADAARLVEAGATFIERNMRAPTPGDMLILMRDPWGNTIRRFKRDRPL